MEIYLSNSFLIKDKQTYSFLGMFWFFATQKLQATFNETIRFQFLFIYLFIYLGKPQIYTVIKPALKAQKHCF